MTISSITGTDLTALSGGLLVARLMLGLGMAAHGSQKMFGWFKGPGLANAGAFFESLGFRPGRFFAAASALAEITSGVLIAAGLLGPIGPALMISVMVVAIATVHWRNGFFVASSGIEHPLLYATGALALAFTGFGAWSLDAVLGLTALSSPELNGLVVLAGVLGALATLALRRTGAPQSGHVASSTG